MALAGTQYNGLYGAANLQDVDGLFRAVPVPQIRALERRTRLDIEKKQSQLRAIVGERYRDLLEAAETIVDLKAQSKEIMTSFEQMRRDAHTTLSDYSEKRRESTSRGRESVSHYNAAACCRMLEYVSELLWDHVEEGELLSAAKYLVMQRRTFFTLSQMDLDRIEPRVRQGIAKKIRSSQQNYSLAKEEVSSKAAINLRDPRSSAADAEDCLVTLIILESISVKECLLRLLDARSERINSLALGQDAAERGDLLLLMARSIITTLEDVIELFLGSEAPLKRPPSLQKRLEGMEKAPLLSLLSSETSSKRQQIWLGHLPEDLSRFSLYLDTEGGLGSIDGHVVKEEVGNWFAKVCHNFQREVRSFVDATTEWDEVIKAIQTIASETQESVEHFDMLLENGSASSPFAVLCGDTLFTKALKLFVDDCPNQNRWNLIIGPTFDLADGEGIVESFFTNLNYSSFTASVDCEILTEATVKRRWGQFDHPWLATFRSVIRTPLHKMIQRSVALRAQARLVGQDKNVDHGLQVAISKTVEELIDVLESRWSGRNTENDSVMASRLCQIGQMLQDDLEFSDLLNGCSQDLTTIARARIEKLATETRRSLIESRHLANSYQSSFTSSYELINMIPAKQWPSAMAKGEPESGTQFLHDDSALLYVPYHLLSSDQTALVTHLTPPRKSTTTATIPVVGTAAMNEGIIEPASKYFRYLS